MSIETLHLVEQNQREYITYINQIKERVWNDRVDKRSPIEQLRNPFYRTLIGIELPPKVNESDERPSTISLVYDLLFKLNADNQDMFLSWFTDIQNQTTLEEREKKLYLVSSLMSAISFLDIDSYKKLAYLKKCTPETPFEILSSIANNMVKTNLPIDASHLDISRVFLSQYKNVIEHISLNDHEINSKHCAPNAVDVGLELLRQIDNMTKSGQISLEMGLRSILNFLEIHEATNINEFFDILRVTYGTENADINKLRNRAIEFNVIQVSETERQHVIHNGLEEIRQREVADAVDIDFSKLFGKQVDQILIAVSTGSFGPWHRGHTYTAEVMSDLINIYNRQDQSFDGIVITAPIVSPEKLVMLTGYKKNPRQVGSIEKRVYCMLATTRHIDKLLFTTQLQPDFSYEPTDRISTTFKNIQKRIDESYSKDKPKTRYVRVFGAEKVIDQDKHQEYRLREKEEAFSNVYGIVMGRRGYLAGLIHLLENVRENFPYSTFVLGPWIPKDSSTRAILNNDFTSLSAVAHKIINGYWEQGSINKRPNEKQELKTPSVTEIYRQLLVEINQLLAN